MRVKIFYDQKQQVNDNSSFSPSAGKPAKVLADWQSHKLPIEVAPVVPLNRAEIALAHSPEYVQGVLSRTKSNGFGNTLKSVAKSLPWTTGSITSAARYALENNTQTISLTSGFHHACYNNGGGFCTFNGLVIAAQMLKIHGLLKKGKVGILDLDMHHGNGTEDIIKKLNLDYIEHYTIGGRHMAPEAAEYFLGRLPEIFDEQFADVDILIYQAGADSCIDDPLGGIFTQEQMRRRDRIVFEQCKRLGLPVAWNLAGGYQERFENVLAIHRATIEEHLKIFHGSEFNTGVEESYVAPKKEYNSKWFTEIEDDSTSWDEWEDEDSWFSDLSEELARSIK